MARTNLLSLFDDFRRHRRDVAVVQRRGYRREAWTYADLARLAYRFEYELRQHGVRTGDRVLLWGANSAAWVAAFWGCQLRGAIAVPVDEGATPDFARRIAQETLCKLFLASETKPLIEPGVPRLKLEDFADRARQPHAGIAQHDPDHPPQPRQEALADEPITREHISQIVFTSGTTAEPRGVVLTHGNFLANLEPLERGIAQYRRYERLLHPLRFVSLVPLSHVFGQFMALFVPPLLGSTVIFEPSRNPADVMRAIQRERASAVIAVPHMLELLRQGMVRELEARGEARWFQQTFAAAEGQKFLWRAWMFRRIHRRLGWKFWAFISGGAALSAETEEFFKRIGYAVVQGYGMTETASVISLNHPFRAAQGSIGKVLPGREFRLAEDGEILVRGENVASGYWQKGALHSSNEDAGKKDGWLCTGDLGELDAEGNLRFRGRKKNVIVTAAGLNVHPEDLEGALRKQPEVKDCVVVALDGDGNEKPCAVLLLNGPGERDGDVAGIVGHANRELSEYQQMRSWLVWPEADFPRTATGKPRLAVIRARALELLSLRGDRRAKPVDALSDLLGKTSGGAGESENLDGELNLSSLDRVELLSALEDRYQVEINETAFAEAKSLADVRQLLREPTSRRTENIYPGWAQREPIAWLRLAVYYALVWPATQILGRPKIIGRENLKDVRGPLLLISNHVTRRADMGLILAALPARFRHRLATAMAGESLLRMRRPPRDWPLVKGLAYRLGYVLVTALFNVFPLPQASGFRESFRFAGESIDRGYSVLVFPEGEVNNSETGAMAPFRSGIGVLSENLGVPIVPMRIDGVWQMKRERRLVARRNEITVHIGTPVRFPAGTAPEEIASALQRLVREL